jgi:hypothetical protein
VPAEIFAEASTASETTTHAEQDVESLRVALGTDQAQATESPAPLEVAAESNPEAAPSSIGSEHEEAQQTVPDHDEVIAKVA